MAEHKQIYLAPKCMDAPYEGRTWCEDDSPQDCDCIDGPHSWIKYVLAGDDDSAHLTTQVEQSTTLLQTNHDSPA